METYCLLLVKTSFNDYAHHNDVTYTAVFDDLQHRMLSVAQNKIPITFHFYLDKYRLHQ